MMGTKRQVTTSGVSSENSFSVYVDLEFGETRFELLRKPVSSALLFLLTISALVSASRIQPVKADESTIYINADGSVSPSTALVSTFDNVTYMFTGNINESIVVQRNNIVINGAGCTVRGSATGTGIDLESVNNVTIENTSITGFSSGIWLNSSPNNTLSNNSISGNGLYGIYLHISSNETIFDNTVDGNNVGIYLFNSSNNALLSNKAARNYKGIVLDSSSNNTLRDNNVTENPAYGIALYSSSYNTFSGNMVVGNAGLGGAGIYLSSSSYNTLSSNNATANYYSIVLDSSSSNLLFQNVFDNSFGSNFVIYGSVLSDYVNWVDASNLVNGKPVYYLVNQDGIVIDSSTHPSVGYLAVVNCTNVIVENLTFTNANRQGALLAYTTNSTIRDNNVLNGDYGIFLYSSSKNTVSDNNVTGTGWGIYIGSSSDNTVRHNNLSGNGVGISLSNDSNNRISDNNVTGNRGGVGLISSFNDTVSCNTIAGSASWGIMQILSSQNTISGNNVTRNNYQGIDIHSSSNDTVTGNIVTGNFGDGIHIYYYCFNETVCDNSVTENTGSGIVLYSSLNNTVIVYPNETLLENNVSERTSDVVSDDRWVNSTVRENNVIGNLNDGIALIRTCGNTVSDNNILGNQYGILVDNASNNAIYHNNFINNTYQAAMSIYGPNTWDNGYPSGGNYWSDNGGTDSYSSSYQNETGSDGVRDAPYVIDSNNTDRYPLMGQIESFVVGTWNGTTCSVDIVSNSTISNMLIDVARKTVSFNISGPEATPGFCRVTIPNLIIRDLWHGNYIVLLNNERWSFANWTDATNTYLYINYTHSEHEVVIIPEFPSTLVVCLFAAFLTVAFVKKKDLKTQT
jgi:parallel beta-helix repeat protein